MSKKKFENQSRAEQCVTIAKDVLAQIKVKRLIPTPGVYVRSNTATIFTAKPDRQVDSLLRRRKCQVCALGAVFVCAVDKADNLKVSDLFYHANSHSPVLFGQEDCHAYLAKYFDYRDLKLIEGAFENWGYDYYSGVCDPTERMVLIMKNIIRNGGKFEYEDQP